MQSPLEPSLSTKRDERQYRREEQQGVRRSELSVSHQSERDQQRTERRTGLIERGVQRVHSSVSKRPDYMIGQRASERWRDLWIKRDEKGGSTEPPIPENDRLWYRSETLQSRPTISTRAGADSSKSGGKLADTRAGLWALRPIAHDSRLRHVLRLQPRRVREPPADPCGTGAAREAQPHSPGRVRSLFSHTCAALVATVELGGATV